MTSPSSRSSSATLGSGQVSGQIVFAALQQTAGRRAILRDREAFPCSVDAVRAVDAAVARTVDQVAGDVDRHTAERLSETLRRMFGRVLKELADLDNPMRTMLAVEDAMEREGVLLVWPCPLLRASRPAGPHRRRRAPGSRAAFPEIPVDALADRLSRSNQEIHSLLPRPIAGPVGAGRPTCRRWRSTRRLARPEAASTMIGASCSTTTATRTTCW